MKDKLSSVENELDLEKRKNRELQETHKENSREYQKLKAQYDRAKQRALLSAGTNASGHDTAPTGNFSSSTTQYQPAHQHQRAPFTNIQMNQPNAHPSNLNNGPTPFRASMKDNGNHRPHPLNDQTSNIGMNSAPFAVNEHQTAAHSLLHQRSTRSTGSVSGGDSPRLTSPNILGNSSGGQNSFRTGGLQQLTSTFGKAPATPRHSHHSSGSSTLFNSARKHHGGVGEGLGNNSKRPQAMFPSAGSMGTPRPVGPSRGFRFAAG